MTFLRSFVVGLLAIVVTTVVMVALETVSMALHPGLDPTTGPVPLTALLLVLLGSVIGAAAGGAVIGRLARPQATPVSSAVGALFTLGQVANLLAIPHPAWFWIPGLLAFLPPYVLVARRVAGV